MEGIHVTAEVCPHHFTLTSDDIRKIEPTVDTEKKVAIEADADTNYKMNPPLRTKEDVQAVSYTHLDVYKRKEMIRTGSA